LLAGLLFGLAAHSVAAQTTPKPTPDPAFTAWVSELRKEALGKGISNATLDSALTGIAPIERIIELDRRQPEFTQTFWRYLDLRVNEKRITRGKALLVQHAKLLKAVEQKIISAGIPSYRQSRRWPTIRGAAASSAVS
jgi:membrane-bound lytic murein transglycosylase B